MKKLLLLLPLAGLTACGTIDPQTAALMAQNFQNGINASLTHLNNVPAYQPIPSAIPTTVPTYAPVILQPYHPTL
jgi:hypothetical protein